MVKAANLKYVTYAITDLVKQREILEDFGLVTVACDERRLIMRGASASPYLYIAEKSLKPGLVSVAVEVSSEQDFLAASKLEGASAIKAIDAPGGGQFVRFNVPGGLTLDVVYGIADVEPLRVKDPEPFNAIVRKDRINSTVRPARDAVPLVVRVGHMSLVLTDPTATKNWLAENLGILVSDTLYVPGGTPDQILGYFVRLDKGLVPADHHTFLLTQGEEFAPHHVSFEVEDLDALYMGNEWMKRQERNPHWGPGRHVIGSQIFDYWWDADGFRIEHYTDGDVFDNTVPPNPPLEGTFDNLWAWGPKFPEDFFSATQNK